MPSKKTPRKTNATNVIGAGAAGGGIGTVIAAVANGLPDNSTYKPVLTVSAPLVAVAISGFWLFIKTVYVEPYVNRMKHEAADAAMNKIIADARAIAETVINDPNSSDDHKKDARKSVADLISLKLRKMTKRMEVVDAD
jgi:hypothetical protein